MYSLFLLKSGNYLLIRRMDNGKLGQRKRRHRRLLISDRITRQIKACSEKSRPRPCGALYPTTFGVNELNFCVRNENRWILVAIATGMAILQLLLLYIIFYREDSSTSQKYTLNRIFMHFPSLAFPQKPVI